MMEKFISIKRKDNLLIYGCDLCLPLRIEDGRVHWVS